LRLSGPESGPDVSTFELADADDEDWPAEAFGLAPDDPPPDITIACFSRAAGILSTSSAADRSLTDVAKSRKSVSLIREVVLALSYFTFTYSAGRL